MLEEINFSTSEDLMGWILEGFWRALGRLWEAFWEAVGPLGAHLGAQGVSGAAILRFWGLLDASWSLLERSWVLLGVSWESLGSFLGVFWGYFW